MNKSWSENLKNLTRSQAGLGAMVKNISGLSGMIVSSGEKIVINSVELKNHFPFPTQEKIAEFENLEKMIEGGWVID